MAPPTHSSTEPSHPSAPDQPPLLRALSGSHPRSYLTRSFPLSLTLSPSFSASPTRLHFPNPVLLCLRAFTSGDLCWNAPSPRSFHLCLQMSPSLWGGPKPPSLKFHSPRPTDFSPSLLRFFSRVPNTIQQSIQLTYLVIFACFPLYNF